MCLRCMRPQSVCYCQHLVSIETATRVVFLQHPRERDMPIGTARMANLCLPNSELHVGVDWQGSSALAKALSDPTRPAALLYPGDDAVDVVKSPPSSPITLVVVDGTWWQTRKLVRANPVLRNLPRYAFTPEAPSEYRIRREPPGRLRLDHRGFGLRARRARGRCRALSRAPSSFSRHDRYADRMHPASARRADPPQEGRQTEAAANSRGAHRSGRRSRLCRRRSQRLAVPRSVSGNLSGRAGALGGAAPSKRRNIRLRGGAEHAARAWHPHPHEAFARRAYWRTKPARALRFLERFPETERHRLLVGPIRNVLFASSGGPLPAKRMIYVRSRAASPGEGGNARIVRRERRIGQSPGAARGRAGVQAEPDRGHRPLLPYCGPINHRPAVVGHFRYSVAASARAVDGSAVHDAGVPRGEEHRRRNRLADLTRSRPEQLDLRVAARLVEIDPDVVLLSCGQRDRRGVLGLGRGQPSCR